MSRGFLVLIGGIFVASLFPSEGRAVPVVVQVMKGLEARIESITALDEGVRLTVPVILRNTGDQFIAIALIPTFATASSSDGTTYFMQEVSGVTRCRNNNPRMAEACMGKPFTQNITIAPGAYTVLEPGSTVSLNFHMARERGNGGGTYANFSAQFAMRTFSSLDEDTSRTDSENYKRTISRSAGFPEVRIDRQTQK